MSRIPLDYDIGKPSSAVIARAIRISFRYRWRLLLAATAALGAALFQLFIPLLLGNSVDTTIELINGRGNASELWLLAGLIVGASLVRGIFALGHTYWGEDVGQRVACDLRMLYYNKLQTLSFSYHDRVHSGDLITRGIVDIEGLRRFVNFAFLRTFLLLMILIIGTVQVIRIDLQTGLIALSFAPFVAAIATYTRLKLRSNWLVAQENLSKLSTVMDENISATKVVRAFASQDYEMSKYDTTSEAVAMSLRRLIRVRSIGVALVNLCFLTATGFVLLLGAFKIIGGSMTAGELTALIAFMFVLHLPVQQLGMMVNAYARTSSTGKRLFQVLDHPLEVRDTSEAKPINVDRGVVEFHNVSFKYDLASAQPFAVSNVSFKASPDHTIGIVGTPGSGKSTIAHLIPRFYNATSGRIIIDGQDIRNVTLESLRNAVTVVEQDSFLFTTSIENNVAYGTPWITDNRIVQAAQAAQLDPYVQGIPMRYATPVGERGVSLSGGQRQRLSIARGVILKPAVIVFDDSTSAVDVATERRIREHLKEAIGKKTVIIISHRLSSLMHADEILFVKDGTIIERGSHEELLKLNGSYKTLYDLQAKPTDPQLLDAT